MDEESTPIHAVRSGIFWVAANIQPRNKLVTIGIAFTRRRAIKRVYKMLKEK